MKLQLKAIRESRGLSQQEIADALNIPVRRYGSWERGERNMNLEDACKIADVLHCSLDEIAGSSSSPPIYHDGRQQALNTCYEKLNDKSKGELTGLASTMTADPSRLAVKSGEDIEFVVDEKTA